MRNPIVHVLPAGASITFEIDPPISVDERPVVVTASGSGAVIVDSTDPGHVTIHNKLRYPVPFMAMIAPKIVLPPWADWLASMLRSQSQREDPK